MPDMHAPAPSIYSHTLNPAVAEQYVHIESTSKGFTLQAQVQGKDGVWTKIDSAQGGVLFETVREAIQVVEGVLNRDIRHPHLTATHEAEYRRQVGGFGGLVPNSSVYTSREGGIDIWLANMYNPVNDRPEWRCSISAEDGFGKPFAWVRYESREGALRAGLEVALPGMEIDAPLAELEGLSREGEAYAVLTDGGELVFFRSEEKYRDGEAAHARDVLGNEYEGRVFTGVETEQWNRDNLPRWRDESVRSACVAEGQAIAPVSCAWWFAYCDGLTDCSLGGLDTSNVTNMDSMFEGCESLRVPPDTSRWDTGKVTDVDFMFYFCKSLATPPDTSKWDTSNVTNMSGMFSCCESIVVPPDTSKWDTSRVKDMESMFIDCHSLVTPPDTNKWDTLRVEDMGYMFSGCRSLRVPPDTSRWDTSRVEDMDYMFWGCESLRVPPDTSRWDTSSIRFADNMFTHCHSLDSTPPNISSRNDPIR